MKKPAITTIFRKQGQSLRLQPAKTSWQKIEQRLDDRAAPLQHRRLWPWWWAVAAALTLALSVTWWSRNQLSPLDQMVLSHPPQSLEELEASGSCEPYCLMLQERDRLPEAWRYPPVVTW